METLWIMNIENAKVDFYTSGRMEGLNSIDH